jgi:hypothetical protein
MLIGYVRVPVAGFYTLHAPSLTAFAAAKANDLAVLLQLGNELIALLDDVVVSRNSQ